MDFRVIIKIHTILNPRMLLNSYLAAPIKDNPHKPAAALTVLRNAAMITETKKCMGADALKHLLGTQSN